MRLALFAATLAAVLFVGPAPADAQVYKFVKKDGSIVYTDSLSQLPPARRAHYNKLEQEREQKRRDLERAIGKDELARREAEAEKERLERDNVADAERTVRLAEVEATLLAIKKRRAQGEIDRAGWQKRIADAKLALETHLEAFRDAQKRYDAIAIKAFHTLLPGEGKKRDDAKAEMDALEKKVDETNTLLTETIPDEARRAGVPPGWLR